jgi:RimK family alpha-L-glutamate ligase
MPADSPASPTVGVLGLHSSKETKAILNAVEALGYDTEWLRRENIAVSIDDGDLTVEPAVDVIANRLLLSTSTHPADDIGLARLFDNLYPMLNRPAPVTTAMHKFATAAALADAGIPVPDALLALSSERLNTGRERFGEQGVYKTAIGTHGGGAWVVDLAEPVNPRVGERQAFLQQFIERDGRPRDTRVYIVDDEHIGSMYRYAPDGEWRTNVSFGGKVEDATDDLPAAAVETARRAADVIDLDYAGVDLIETDGEWQVLEINPTAGFRGLFKATGRSPAPSIAALAIERGGGSVDPDRVAELAETLDDSKPACMPRQPSLEPNEPAVIGYIEEVVVSGTRGSRMVMAKSDTGATRTSIDSHLATEIGSGPIKDIITVRSGSLKQGKSRPVVDIVVGVGGTQHTVTASVEDRSHMDFPLLLGRDILEHYHVDVTRRADSADDRLEE